MAGPLFFMAALSSFFVILNPSLRSKGKLRERTSRSDLGRHAHGCEAIATATATARFFAALRMTTQGCGDEQLKDAGMTAQGPGDVTAQGRGIIGGNAKGCHPEPFASLEGKLRERTLRTVGGHSSSPKSTAKSRQPGFLSNTSWFFFARVQPLIACELSAAVRSSKTIPLGDPVMPVFDGLSR